MFLSKYDKEQFKNIYFITGCATGGKTTISKAIAEKYGFIRYDADAEFDKHKKLSNAIEQPAMNKQFKNADDFFLRDVADYVQWLKDNTAEQLQFILDDIIKLSQSNKVVCDLHLSVNEAKQIAYNIVKHLFHLFITMSKCGGTMQMGAEVIALNIMYWKKKCYSQYYMLINA